MRKKYKRFSCDLKNESECDEELEEEGSSLSEAEEEFFEDEELFEDEEE
ncbi:MAG: hypothetical protein QW273_03710 [Candidatus Pacearchaeota archaeon]